MYGINLNATMPLRIFPSQSKEMINQLLFGELIIIHETIDGWARVENLSDGYQGWADKEMCTQLSTEEFEELRSIEKTIVATPVAACEVADSHTMILGIGSVVYPESNTFGNKYTVAPELLKQLPCVSTPEELIRIAKSLLGSSYLKGGKSVMGMDNSAFIQLSCIASGIQLPRNIKEQALYGEIIPELAQSQPGDLIFFEDEDENIIHGGILLEEQKIIHALGKVRIDEISSEGIINTNNQTSNYRLHSIKRLF